jgi:hypothetical protein
MIDVDLDDFDEWIAGQAEPIGEPGPNGWVITDDSEANGVAIGLRLAEQERDRLKAIARHQESLIAEWLALRLKPVNDRINRKTEQLISYRRHREEQDPKLAATYHLPAAELKRRKGTTVVEDGDTDVFAAWIEDTRFDQLVTTTVKVAKAEVSRAVKAGELVAASPDDTGRIDLVDPTTGEVVPGVWLTRNDDTYSVTTNRPVTLDDGLEDTTDPGPQEESC